MIAISSVALAISMCVAVGMGVMRSGLSWRAHAPTWVLVMDLEHVNPASFHESFTELAKRHAAVPLPQVTVERIAEAVLAYQGQPALLWQTEYGDFVQDEMIRSGAWNEAKRLKYLQQGMVGAVTIEVRPRVRVGEDVTARVTARNARFGRGLAVQTRVRPTGIEGERAWQDGAEALVVSYGAHNKSSMMMPIRLKGISEVAVPRQPVKVIAEMTMRQNLNGSYASGPALAAWVTEFEGVTEVVETGAEIVRSKAVPELAGAMRRAVKLHDTDLAQEPSGRSIVKGAAGQGWRSKPKPRWWINRNFSIQGLPMPVCFEICARKPGSGAGAFEQQLGQTVSSKTGENFIMGGQLSAFLHEDVVHDGKTDLIFRFSKVVAEQQVEDVEWWDGEIVIQGVDVHETESP
jgi:hypothetical protein